MNEHIPADQKLCPTCGAAQPSPIDTIGVWLMYDCHAFRGCVGKTVLEIVADWREEHDNPDPEGGPPSLCPVRVLAGEKTVRTVGPMVHAVYRHDDADRREKQKRDLKRWIAECNSDPDIPRLLAAGRTYSEVHKRD